MERAEQSAVGRATATGPASRLARPVLASVVRRPRALRGLAAVQLAALVVLGGGAANRHYVFSGD